MTSELNEINFSDYEIILKTKKGRFFLSIPDLKLIASGNSLEQAYQLLTEKKESFLKELQEADLTLPKQEPVSKTGARSPQKFAASSLRDNVLGFIMKIVIVGIALIVIIVLSSAQLEIQTTKVINAIDKAIIGLNKTSSKTIKDLKTIIPKKPGRSVEREIIRAGNHKVEPARQERLRLSIRKLVKKWKPIVKEFRPLFEE